MTYDETEAVHQGWSRNSAAKITRHERALQDDNGPSTPSSFGRLSFFIATWIKCPRVDNSNFGQTSAPFFLVANKWSFPKWTPVFPN
ncbi:hypothetical protein MTP99_003679 [Tenebrio molitor]|nr:hypothetical protein MTP99_003679 [Tenebrio molitor]